MVSSGFPRIALRILQTPIYLLVVLAQVNLSALLSGLATFMAKFIEKQFSQTVSFSNMIIGETDDVIRMFGFFWLIDLLFGLQIKLFSWR